MLLARAAVVEPDLLLLDEPTNHLDIGRIGVLQRFLFALPRDCAVIAASHDRAFLDDVTNRTLFLRPAESEVFSLPYSRALAKRWKSAMAARDRQYENDMRKVKALRQQAAKLKNIGINSGSDLLVVKTKQLSERADRLAEERARPAHQERSAGAIRLTNSGTHAKALVTINDTAITTPDGRVLFRTGKTMDRKGGPDRCARCQRDGQDPTGRQTARGPRRGGSAYKRQHASLKLGTVRSGAVATRYVSHTHGRR